MLQREKVMSSLLAHVPRPGVFFVLENCLGLMGVAYKERWEFGDHLKKIIVKKTKTRKIKQKQPCLYRTPRSHSERFSFSVRKSLWWQAPGTLQTHLVLQKPFSNAQVLTSSPGTTEQVDTVPPRGLVLLHGNGSHSSVLKPWELILYSHSWGTLKGRSLPSGYLLLRCPG